MGKQIQLKLTCASSRDTTCPNPSWQSSPTVLSHFQVPKDEGAGLSLGCHDIESWPDTHAPLIPISWSVRLHSALDDVRVEGQPYLLANSSREPQLNPSDLFRVIHLSLLQIYMPHSCSGMGRAVQRLVSHLPLPTLQPDPRPTPARWWPPVACSCWVRPLSSHRILVPGMAMETTKKGQSPSSPRQPHIASGWQRLGVRYPPCLLPILQQPLGWQQNLFCFVLFFVFKGKKREKKKERKRRKREGVPKKPTPKPNCATVQHLKGLPSVTPWGRQGKAASWKAAASSTYQPSPPITDGALVTGKETFQDSLAIQEKQVQRKDPKHSWTIQTTTAQNWGLGKLYCWKHPPAPTKRTV